MYYPSKSPARALCALSLALSLAAAPAAAVEAAPSQPDPDPETAQLPAQQSHRPEVAQYLRCAPQLLELGYSQKEVDALFSALPAARILSLLREPYDPAAAVYIRQPHFRAALFQRYVSCGQSQPTLTPDQVVTRVNAGLDRTPYTGIRAVRDPDSHQVLVNKYNFLSPSFAPALTPMDSRYANYAAYMEPTAYRWFVQMADNARKEGLTLYAVSAYRSYSYQRQLYQRYVRQDGRATADTYSARPGYSEHQTGLAVDINTASSSAHFENTGEYRWLSENSWKYGFILRYPQGKEEITGFRFEPWHYRYVGTDLAQKVYESGLTYDEYVASLPQEEDLPAGSLSFHGRELPSQSAPLRLGGAYYLPAGELAALLKLSCVQPDADTAVLSGPGLTLTLSSGQTQCAWNGEERTMARAPFAQNETLMVPLADAAELLGLELDQREDTLVLSVPMPDTPGDYL